MEPNKTKKSLGDRLRRVFLEDQYHLGKVDLRNPVKNHYIFGLFPRTDVRGEKAEGKIRTFGIVSIFEAGEGIYVKDNGNYGLLFATDNYGNGCQVEKSTIIGGIGSKERYGASCQVEKSTSFGGIVNICNSDIGCKIKKSRNQIGLLNIDEYLGDAQLGLFGQSVINED